MRKSRPRGFALRPELQLLEEVLGTQGHCRVRVGGNCMYPVIRCGAYVDIVKVASDDLSVGDICAYFFGGQLKVHRLKQKESRFGHFCSDRGKEPLQRVSLEGVLGKIEKIANPHWFYRVQRKVLEYVSQARGLLCLS